MLQTLFFGEKWMQNGRGPFAPPLPVLPLSDSPPSIPGEAKPTGKSHEFVLLPFMLLSNFEIRGCFFFNFEIDSISETLTNAKTRHDFFLALGLFVVNVECLSGLALGLSGLGSSLVLPCLVYLFCCCCCCFLRRRRTVICLAGKLN